MTSASPLKAQSKTSVARCKTTASQVVWEQISEKDFQDWVVHVAQVLGWRIYHTYDSRRSNPGWPDLVLVRAGRLIFAELKSQKGKATAEQLGWLTALGVVAEMNQTVETYLWRPSDRSEIEEVLKRVG